MGMFSTAPKAPAPAKGKKEKVVVKVAGLEAVAAFDVVIKSMTALKATMADTIKEGPMTDQFVSEGLRLKRTPDSFRGTEGNAEASCELRKRSTTSPLSDEEVALCEENNIPVEEVQVVVDTFIFNPVHLQNPLLMAEIEKALSKVKGLPSDLIQHQEGVSKKVVAEGALDTLFRDHDEETVREMLPVLTVSAIKPKMTTDDMKKAFEVVDSIMNPSK